MISPIFLSNKSVNYLKNFKISKKRLVQMALGSMAATTLIRFNTQSDLRERLIKKTAELSKTKKVVTETEKMNRNALKSLGIRDKDINRYLDSKGHINDVSIKKQLKDNNIAFKGDDTPHPSDDLSDGEYIGTPPEIFDDMQGEIAETVESGAELGELEEIDKALENTEKLMNNPLLAAAGVGIISEVTPVVRFVKPIKDLLNGDVEKAFTGAITRGFDMSISLFKLAGALGAGLGGGLRGLIDNDKSFTFFKCYSEFYEKWAKKRDELEDKFLNRETKNEKRKRLSEERKRLVAERTRRIEERKRKIAEERKQAEERQIKEQEINHQKELIALGKGDIYRGIERDEFENLLVKYKEVKPNADLSKFSNYTSWNSKRISKNAKMVEREMQSINRRQRNNDDNSQAYNYHDTYEYQVDKTLTENYRKEFASLLSKYQTIKPGVDISQYNGWGNWHHNRLNANIKHLRKVIASIERKAVS